MSERKALVLRTFPDSVLRQKSHPVEMDRAEQADRQLLVDAMKNWMVRAQGVGISAIQLGVPVRLFLVDINGADSDKPDIEAFFNPEIITATSEKEAKQEGCLSFPGLSVAVERSAGISVKAQRIDGRDFEFMCDGFVARAIQHELDHLDGKLFVDHLSRTKRDIIARKMAKQRKVGLIRAARRT